MDDGTWRVGIDIAPGSYRTEGSEGCYWERLSGFGGELDDIIANSDSEGPSIVTIAATDAGFLSDGCGTWQLDEAAPPLGGSPEVTDPLTWLEGEREILLMLRDGARTLDGNNRAAIKRTARPLAAELRSWLLSVRPDECYVEKYVAWWVLYGTLQNMADGTQRSIARFLFVPNFRFVAETTDCT